MNKDIVGCGAGDCPSSSSKDMFGCRNKGVRGSGISDFVTKAYNIVNDPNTNPVVSWSLSGNSLIIWDHIKFAAEILPKFFKHNNLSSFIYQLNNYGFRKIGVEHQWEYENPYFQAGKEYLLAKMKRRGQNRETKKNPSYRIINNNRVEIKADILRNGINESKLEIEKLKTQQSEMESQIAAVESEMKSFESKSKKLMMCCEEVFKIGKNMNEARKKRKLGENEKTGDREKMAVVDEEPVLNVSDENQLVSSTGADDCEVGLGNNSSEFMYWKRILQEDDELCGEAGTEMENKQVLEGLIAKLDGQNGEVLEIVI
ncbi:hypothetical protein CASFOL_040705 [Castilleja foliolosa]|uniref:HSF-type DNA-binding domain-containing protein n=1 Tax=Castilleja foliolosa TaxID=1961234 RepID=A0ABD3BCQ1_9LAMI